jgi:hypothetical protein
MNEMHMIDNEGKEERTMKKLVALIAGVFLSCFLIVAVNAEPNVTTAGSQQKSGKAAQSVTKKKLSKRNKAKAEVQAMKAKRNAQAAEETQK